MKLLRLAAGGAVGLGLGTLAVMSAGLVLLSHEEDLDDDGDLKPAG